jgi:hypothetical protein
MNIYQGNHIVEVGKYLGDKQVYNLIDFIQYWKVFGFLRAIKELRKPITYYLINFNKKQNAKKTNS